MTRAVLSLLIVAALAGCQTLPRDGPSGRSVASADQSGYVLVDLDAAVAERIRLVSAPATTSLAGADSDAPVDVIGIGDTLTVAIFEPSGTLFGPRGNGASVQSGNQTLPPVTVDRSGGIAVPFAGSVRVVGLTAPQAAEAVRRSLVGKVAAPQVVVSIASNPSNGVTVLGEVRNPGRTSLNVNGNRVLDVIAAAGGASRPSEDVTVVVRRGGDSWSAPLSALNSEFGQNIRLAPGDQVNLVHRPRRYAAFGALGSVSETDMGAGDLTLAGALGRAGGLDPQSANARAVMVFRFERPEVAQALGLTQAPTPRGVPVVYRLDLAEPDGFFAAGRFLIQPDDVLYVPRSDSAEARKFFEFVQSITRVVYDVSVTSTLSND